MDFNSASSLLTGRNKNKKKLRPNTYLLRITDKEIAVKLHDTNIITFTPEYAELNSGGWRTNTTRDRLELYAPTGFSMWQRQFVWYVSFNECDTCIFQDGMKIYNNGKIIGAGSLSKETKKVKEIKEYCQKYVDRLFAGKINQPSAGDCLYCRMQEADTGTNFGESVHSSHIQLHIEEKYYVPSLIFNAINKYPISIVASNDLGACLKYDGCKLMMEDFSRKKIYSSLKKYVTNFY